MLLFLIIYALFTAVHMKIVVWVRQEVRLPLSFVLKFPVTLSQLMEPQNPSILYLLVSEFHKINFNIYIVGYIQIQLCI